MSLIDTNVEATALMHQAAGTASFYLGAALEACEKFEIKPHPEIVAAFMQVAAHDFDTSAHNHYAERRLQERAARY